MQIFAPEIEFPRPCTNGHAASPNTIRVQNEAGETWTTCYICCSAFRESQPHWLSRFCQTGIGCTLVLALAVVTIACVFDALIGVAR